MKLFVFLVFLIGCSDRATQVHETAKLLGSEQKVCYTATQPENIRGYYCLQYMGLEKNGSRLP
jgi:hypothetical protein